MKTSVQLRLLTPLLAKDLVGAAYLGMLGRPVDEEGLRHYCRRLRRPRRKAVNALAEFLAAISRSPEHWQKQLNEHALELTRSAYRAMLGREPREGEVAPLTQPLEGEKDLAAAIATIVTCDEHWEKVLARRSEDIVKATFQALLGRHPEPEALHAYAGALQQTKCLSDLMRTVGESEEHWQRLFDARAEELVGALYRGLLRREPDSAGLRAYAAQLRATRNLTAVVASLGDSHERAMGARSTQWPHPSASYDQPTWVFLHVQKTAGTSLQNMLAETFGAAHLYREHGDTLYLHSPAELSSYAIFAGHFTHDSLSFIPRRELRVFTFVRESKERLLSLYNFWRAHDPDAPAFHSGMSLARQLGPAEFFQHPETLESYETWNHTTWCLMGARKWHQWRNLLAGKTAKERSHALTGLRLRIRKQLESFAFVGLHEDFTRSCALLFSILGRPCPRERDDHSVANLSTEHRYIRNISKPPLTPSVTEAMVSLSELDAILYEEACAMYTARHGEVPSNCSTASSAVPPQMATANFRHAL
jgi:hypothetical protein